MATSHTYFVPHRDRCYGELGESPEMVGALRALWERLSKERAQPASGDASAQAEGDEGESAGPRFSPDDGVAAWLDASGAVQVRFVWQGVSEDVLDPSLLTVLQGVIVKGKTPS